MGEQPQNAPSNDQRCLLDYRAMDYRFRLDLPAALSAGIERALVDLTADSSFETQEPHEVWTIDFEEGPSNRGDISRGPQVVVRVGELEQHCDGAEGPFSRAVVSLLNRRSLEYHSEYLHFHSGGVNVAGVGILLVGQSGAGKSTLTAGLLAAGALYYSDEDVMVDPSTLMAHGFPKPLSIKTNSRPLVRQLLGHEPLGDNWQIPASSLLSGPAAPVRPTVLISYRHRSDDDALLEPLERSSMALDLLQGAMNFERFGPAALDVVGHLLEGASCWRLRANALDDAVSAVQSTVEEPHSGHGSYTPIASTIGVRTTADAPIRSSSTSSFLIDGRAVIAGPDSQLIELDAAASVWWTLLDGPTPMEIAEIIAHRFTADLGAAVEGGRTLIEKLADLGLLQTRMP